MDRRIDEALDAAFPDRAVASVGPAGTSWNEGNRTVRIEFADGDAAYLKVAIDGDGTRVRRERAAIAYADENCSVRVPRVTAADADETEREDLLRQFGRALAAVHGADVDVHGYLVGDAAEGLDVEPAPWTDVLADTIEESAR